MYDMADVPTYEEVAPYRRQAGARHRLVVFVGERKVSSLSLSSSISVELKPCSCKAGVRFLCRRHRTLLMGPSGDGCVWPLHELGTQPAFFSGFRLRVGSQKP